MLVKRIDHPVGLLETHIYAFANDQTTEEELQNMSPIVAWNGVIALPPDLGHSIFMNPDTLADYTKALEQARLIALEQRDEDSHSS